MDRPARSRNDRRSSLSTFDTRPAHEPDRLESGLPFSNYFLSKGSIVVADYSDSSTDIGLNGKVGSTFGKGNVKPFAEFGFVISDSSWLYGQAGARYAL